MANQPMWKGAPVTYFKASPPKLPCCELMKTTKIFGIDSLRAENGRQGFMNEKEMCEPLNGNVGSDS
jgi:hypothetical protein